mmetsp:Transcript_105720/g.297341  ORF Transcript_105720/g.297341 Transcript_105720/m.297341 type:complete len:225 (-) Transcript_105720:52-726(-)
MGAAGGSLSADVPSCGFLDQRGFGGAECWQSTTEKSCMAELEDNVCSDSPHHYDLGHGFGAVSDASSSPVLPHSTRSASGLSEDGSPSPRAWARRFREGVFVALDGERVLVTLDAELNCLEVREHEALYPLAELRTCFELPSGSEDAGDDGKPAASELVDTGESTYGLLVNFADYDALLFQFDEEKQRAGFCAALNMFACEARAETPEVVAAAWGGTFLAEHHA